MALVPWKPLEELGTLRHEMDRLFERFFGEWPTWPKSDGGWAPRIDMAETGDSVTIKAELPGLEAKDVDVSIFGNTLTVRGEKKEEREEKDEHYHLVERAHGTFSRVVRLPAAVDVEKIKASFKNGVLTVTLPKTEEARQKAIPVSIE
jgi:HSP20 family protein